LEYDEVFIPVNKMGLHWFGLVISVGLRTIHFYDPLKSAKKDGSHYCHALFEWLKFIWSIEKNEDMPESEVGQWKFIVTDSTIPPQKDSCNCGVYLILLFIFLSDGLSTEGYDDHIPDSEVSPIVNSLVVAWRKTLAVAMHENEYLPCSLYDSSSK